MIHLLLLISDLIQEQAVIGSLLVDCWGPNTRNASPSPFPEQSELQETYRYRLSLHMSQVAHQTYLSWVDQNKTTMLISTPSAMLVH